MNKLSTAIILIFILLTVASVALAYDRYMNKEDFVYFQTEDELPEPFDKVSYE